MKIVRSSVEDIPSLLGTRGVSRDRNTECVVEQIIEDVRSRGDAALLDNVRRFDAPEIQSIHVRASDMEAGVAATSTTHYEALARAYENIVAFHTAQRDRLFGSMKARSSESGVADYHWSAPFREGVSDSGEVGQRYIPLSSAALYVPGGRAAYPSTVLMNAGPGLVAGVQKLYVATPAQPNGDLPAAVCAAMQIASTSGCIKVGGAAAIAAYALGTETVPRVDKIVGPGNRFVNEAKRQLWGQVGVDGYAGPSEVCVLVDDTANAAFAAADFLTQIEHAPDNAGYLISVSEAKLQAVLSEIDRQILAAPRGDVMREAMRGECLAILARERSEACEIVNLIAPEHLSLAVAEPEHFLTCIRNAGCVLIGDYTPESAADYCIGPSHTLPTSGSARWQSPLSVLDFVKVQSVSRLSQADLSPMIPVIEALGDIEGFPGHAFGATVRRRS